MKWVLVTGGTGFIGTNLCKALLMQGKHVIALDNHITSPEEQKHIHENHPFYRFLYRDITTGIPQELLPEAKSIETIYHLACPTGVRNLITLAEEMALTCSLGTRNVLEIARLHNADFVFTSSSEVYGNPKVFPQKESYTGNVLPVGTRSPYEEGKRFSETLIALYVKKYRIKAKIVRVFNTYGPYMSAADTRVIPKFIHLIKAGQPITIMGDGKQSRTFCYVDDLVDGILTVQKKGDIGEIYNLGSDTEISIAELAKLLLSMQKKYLECTNIPHFIEDHQRRLPSLEKTYQLGWSPSTSLIDGLQQTLQWYGL